MAEEKSKSTGRIAVKGALLHHVRTEASLDLSLVVICHNVADRIEALLGEWREFFVGTAVPFEILAVNDGSTDGTGRVLDKMRRENACLRVIHQLHIGEPLATRRAYDHARGRYLLRVDGEGACGPEIFEPLWAGREGRMIVIGRRARKPIGLWGLAIERCLRMLSRGLFRVAIEDPGCPARLLLRPAALVSIRNLPESIRHADLALCVWLLSAQPSLVAEVDVGVRVVPRPPVAWRRPSPTRRALGFARDLLRLRRWSWTQPFRGAAGALPARLPA